MPRPLGGTEMNHDTLIRYERLYMQLAARPYLNPEARGVLNALQYILRHNKKVWEGQ